MKQARTILVVEDERDLRDVISFNLKREGYVCRRAADGAEALTDIATTLPDLVILDRMLPNTSGDEVVTQLRRDVRTAAIPILMLTAKTEESDELVGFALGADDYVTKPFSMKTLMARVGALLRRAERAVATPDADVISSGPVTLDTQRRTVSAAGTEVVLTATEFRLLAALMAADGRLRTRNQLIDAALGVNVTVVDRTIDVHVAALRKKLGAAAGWMQTIRGAGYAWRRPANVD
ncbi:MAG: response regulator [Phycisphaerae bacterium]